MRASACTILGRFLKLYSASRAIHPAKSICARAHNTTYFVTSRYLRDTNFWSLHTKYITSELSSAVPLPALTHLHPVHQRPWPSRSKAGKKIHLRHSNLHAHISEATLWLQRLSQWRVWPHQISARGSELLGRTLYYILCDMSLFTWRLIFGHYIPIHNVWIAQRRTSASTESAFDCPSVHEMP